MDNTKRGYYTLKLTSRHEFPEDAKWAIFPSQTIRGLHDDAKELAYYVNHGEKSIPKDCTHLRVYMSGLKMYHLALLKICQKRAIKLTMLWWREDGKYKEDEVLNQRAAKERVQCLVNAIRKECGSQCNL